VTFAVPSGGFPTRSTYSLFTRVIKLKTYFLDLFKGAVRLRTESIIVFHVALVFQLYSISIIKNKNILVVTYS
jgi:hypothetical protein